MRIILFGASSYGEEIFGFLEEYAPHVHINLFLDNDERKSKFLGVPVEHPNDVVLRQDMDVVIITSQYYEEIKVQLTHKGLRENIDFFSGNLLIGMAKEMEQVELKIKKLESDNIPYRIVTKQDFKKKKTSDTIFLLGSGSSINEITEEQWSHIKQNDSWGFNYWTVHEFIPTFYSFEFPVEKKKNHLDNIIWNYFQRKKSDELFNISLIKDITAYSKADFDVLSTTEILVPIAKDLNLYCNNEEMIIKHLILLNKLNFWESDIFIKMGFSVMMLINTSVALGYKNIVLCGIDLNNNAYFFKENEKYYNDLTSKFERKYEDDKNSIHPTMDMEFWAIRADLIIKLLNKYLLIPSGVKLSIMNSSSALYPDIDLYEIL